MSDGFEKARGGPRAGMIPYGSRHQYGRAKFFEARAKRRGETQSERAVAARKYLAGRFKGGRTASGKPRSAFYKSESHMTVEKASPRGVGAKASIFRRRLALLARKPGAAYALGPRLAGLKSRVSAVQARVKKSDHDPIEGFYEAVEKAGMVPKGGSARLRQRVMDARKKTYDRIYRSNPYSSKGVRVASARVFPKRRK